MDSIAKKVLQNQKVIGRNRYNNLKKYDFKEMNTEDMVQFRILNKVSVAEAEKMIESYENKNSNKKEANDSLREYHKRVINPVKKESVKKKEMDKEWLFRQFEKEYLIQNGVRYLTDFDSIENLKPLIYYFIGDFEEFKKCKNVSIKSVPSMEKGLLIIGSYGIGKTSIMKALEKVLEKTNIRFKGFSANEVITQYENCTNGAEKSVLRNRLETGINYFDDILTERLASNFGKVNIFRDVFLEQ